MFVIGFFQASRVESCGRVIRVCLFRRTIWLALLAVSLRAHSGVLEEKLSAALMSRDVGSVRMLLLNGPNLGHHTGNNYESLLWLSLFGGATAAVPAPDFSVTQKEMAGLLVDYHPAIVDLPVMTPPEPPLVKLFKYLSRACKKAGCASAYSIRERIQFLIDRGARMEKVFTNEGLSLPIYLADQNPEVFEFALKMGLAVDSDYLADDGRSISLLGHLSLIAVRTLDESAVDEAFKKIEMLLSRGSNPRREVSTSAGEPIPLFLLLLAEWDHVVKEEVETGRRNPLTVRFPRMFRGFMEHGLSAFEPFFVGSKADLENRWNILYWTIQHPGRRGSIMRFFHGYAKAEYGEIPPCEVFLNSGLIKWDRN